MTEKKPWQRDLGEYYKMVPSGEGTVDIEDGSSVLIAGLSLDRAEEVLDLLHSVRSTWWGEGYLEAILGNNMPDSPAQREVKEWAKNG